jgi:hypothetical protein
VTRINGPVSARQLLATWQLGLPLDQAQALELLLGRVDAAIQAARASPATLHSDSLALVITHLEEAEHWAMVAVRSALASAADARRNSG